jgi:endonuclease III-like uncharacterized protein
MSSELNSRIKDLATWYYYHESHIEDIKKRLEFYQDAISTLIEIVAIIAKDIQNLENKPKDDVKLLIPKGIRFHDPIRS